MRRGPVGPAESAAESTKGLIERRQYSRNVNYAAIDSLFESNPDDERDSRAATPLHGVDEKTDEKGDDDDDHDGEYETLARRVTNRLLIDPFHRRRER
jgi:hypothetical protein